MLLVAEEKSHNCLEGDVYSATDNYFNLQSIYTQCLEGGIIVFQKGHHTSPQTEFKKGNIPWDKGKVRIEMVGENNPAKRPGVRAKISEAKRGNKARLGMRNSEDHNRRISKTKKGENNPCFGKPISIERRMKQAKAAKINPNYGMKNKHHTETTKRKMSDSKLGEKSSNWRGGISFDPYCPKFNGKLKEKIRDRDDHTCQLCPCTEEENGKKLSVHHVHYDKENCAPDLISLCNRCNAKVNFNRDHYESLFMLKLKSRGLLC